MCRHLAFIGPPVALASLVLDPDHSLYRQSWAPRDMRGGGSVNADGFGLGWYVDGEPVRYRRSVPIWADENLPGLARSTTSTALLAAVRNGTVGMPLGEPAVAPFQSGRWFFSHNGLIPGWPESIAKLAETLPARDLLTLDAPMDSAFLWALVRSRLHAAEASRGRGESDAGGGAGVAEVVRDVVLEVAEVASGARLNVLLTDGEQVVGTAWTHSLWVRRVGPGVTVASEPFEEAGWEAVPEYSLVVADATGFQITSLEG